LPLLWDGLRDPEKILVGAAYAEAYAAGEATTSAGLKKALLKVRGFDWVPENLRSQSFIKAAEKFISAHEAFNNYYNEPAPVNELRSLGTVIPIPAFPICATAILSVVLGNPYGTSHAAQPPAHQVLANFTQDRWQYYLTECLPSDNRILSKLVYESPCDNFFELVRRYRLSALQLSGKVRSLVQAAAARDKKEVFSAVEAIRREYFGRR
jgi:hypothetical protein